MTNYRTREPHYLQARRAFNRLRLKHRALIRDEHEFMDADRSICPEVWDAVQEEPLFGCTSCTTEDKLLIEVAREFCIDPVLLDDMMIAADYAEQDRQVARALATTGVCAYYMRGLECRNAPMNKPGTCGCRGAH